MAILKRESFDDLSRFAECAGRLYANDPIYRDAQIRPDEYGRYQLFTLVEGDMPIGRVAALANPHVRYDGQVTGQIGFFECVDDVAAAGKLLDAACQELGHWGCRWAVGPMNGSTWRSYRVVQPNGSTPFFMEPYHQPYYDRLFRANNFAPVAEYKTTRISRENFAFDRLARAKSLFDARGIYLRSVTAESFAVDIRKIYEICVASFTENFLYSAIGYEAFSEIYAGVEAVLGYAPVLLAEDRDQGPVGFVFCVPDLLAKEKRSLIIKSLAVVPGRSHQGLGGYLVECVHKYAHDTGIQAIFHALMHCNNPSTNIGGASESYRTYTLHGRAL